MPQLDESYVLVPEGRAFVPPRVLPEGVVRIGEAALAAERLLAFEPAGAVRAKAHEDSGKNSSVDASADASTAASAPRVRIAAFDFDGTSMRGNSPVLLVRYLARLGMLRKSVLARIILWAGAYKARLPQNESWVRGLVFSAFEGKPVGQVNEFLRNFYDEVVDERFRGEADATMQAHLDAGHVVVCVSATFEPIIAQAMCAHPIQFGISTRMQIDARGRYIAQVEGLPVEGAEKMAALTAFANERYGEGKWELGWAYGDHHSDRALLAAAEHGFAVTPDRPLARTAHERGYAILNWGEE